MSMIAGGFLFLSVWVGAGLLLDNNLPGAASQSTPWQTTIQAVPARPSRRLQFIVD